MKKDELVNTARAMSEKLKGDIKALILAMDEDGCNAMNIPLSKPLEESSLDDVSSDLGEFLINITHAIRHDNEQLADAINNAIINVAISLTVCFDEYREPFFDAYEAAKSVWERGEIK